MTDEPRDRADAEPDHRSAPSSLPLLDQSFGDEGLYSLRSAVAAHAGHAGLAEGRVHDLVAAVHELAANAVRHGGGAGRLRLWQHSRVLHCQVDDKGRGTGGPDRGAAALWGLEPGSGLWTVRRLVDQMDLQTGPYGTIATVSVTLEEPEPRVGFAMKRVDHPRCTVVAVEGELDFRSTPRLIVGLTSVIDAIPEPRLVLDLSDLALVDSSGIVALVDLHRRVAAAPGGRLVLAGLSERVESRLRMVGLTQRVVLSPGVDQAVAEMSKT